MIGKSKVLIWMLLVTAWGPAAAQIREGISYPQRSMGLADPQLNPVLDAVPGDIRVLPPVRLYPKGGGGFDDWPGKLSGAIETTRDGNVFNVTSPSYQAFLPSEGRNTRTAVVIAPGGGFRMISIATEGDDVAKWLAARGIAAFVVKYRIVQQSGPEFSMNGGNQKMAANEVIAPGTADGMEAVREIRARAADYGIEPNRIVFIGFSAGAYLATVSAMQAVVADRPNYFASIYGGLPPEGLVRIPPRYLPGTVKTPASIMPGMTLPATGTLNPAALPPTFIAVAQDDFLQGPSTLKFYDALLDAGYEPEAHFYANGLHGFGLAETKSSSRHFIEDFYWWMETLGLTRKPGAPDLKYKALDMQALVNGGGSAASDKIP